MSKFYKIVERYSLLDECYVGSSYKITLEATDESSISGWTEQVWLECISILPGRTYIGELLVEPVAIPGLYSGDLIKFKARHVIDVS